MLPIGPPTLMWRSAISSAQFRHLVGSAIVSSLPRVSSILGSMKPGTIKDPTLKRHVKPARQGSAKNVDVPELDVVAHDTEAYPCEECGRTFFNVAMADHKEHSTTH